MFKCCKFLDKGAGRIGTTRTDTTRVCYQTSFSSFCFSVHLEPKKFVNRIIMTRHLLSVVLQFVSQNVGPQ